MPGVSKCLTRTAGRNHWYGADAFSRQGDFSRYSGVIRLMTSSLSFRILLALTSLLFVSSAPLAAQDDEGINWLSSYKQALEEAKRTQKPIFLEFRCEA